MSEIKKLKDIIIDKNIQDIQEAINNLDSNRGQLSDTHHTFDELYEHRAVLFNLCCQLLTKSDYGATAWKSRKHHIDDKDMFEGSFVVGFTCEFGEVSYHYDTDLWGFFDVEELETAPKYTGYTPNDTLDVMRKLIASL